MRIRTIYFKVSNIDQAEQFWSGLLDAKPTKSYETWREFLIHGTRLALLADSGATQLQQSRCVPVFEIPDEEMLICISKAKSLGATIVFDALDDPAVKSIVLADPFGNEFELCKLHN